MPRSIADILQEARAQLERVSPAEAAERAGRGALIIDIRPRDQRAQEGEIPASLLIERNHLEWRFDLLGDASIPQVTSYEQDVIVVCSEGYTSSLAALALQQLGFTNATDIVGGFVAWQAAGLPTQPGGTPAPGL